MLILLAFSGAVTEALTARLSSALVDDPADLIVGRVRDFCPTGAMNQRFESS
jgi:hypothetical protein